LEDTSFARLLCRIPTATKSAVSHAPDGILQTSTSRKLLPLCLSQKKFVPFFYVHTTHSHTYYPHTFTHFFPLLFFRFSSTPPSLVISLLAHSTLFRATVQIEACSLLTPFLAIHLLLTCILRAMLTLSYEFLC
jgi:hypothetical protein